MDPQHPHTSKSSDESSSDMLAEMERRKLYFMERMLKEQEKTNSRLHSILENQKQEFHNQ